MHDVQISSYKEEEGACMLAEGDKKFPKSGVERGDGEGSNSRCWRTLIVRSRASGDPLLIRQGAGLSPGGNDMRRLVFSPIHHGDVSRVS